MVLVVALLVMGLLTLLGTVFLTISSTESNISFNERNTSRAFNIAEAGIELARKQVSSASWPSSFSSLTLTGLIKEYCTANKSDASLLPSDWSTTAPDRKSVV